MNPEMITTLSLVRSKLSRFHQLAEERSFDNIDQFFFFDDMESIIEDCETILEYAKQEQLPQDVILAVSNFKDTYITFAKQQQDLLSVIMSNIKSIPDTFGDDIKCISKYALLAAVQ